MAAKEDFCFTYYDGDAARDMAHMNRLERGAYGDIIVSQRKFGRLSFKLLKKTLGNDFENVWEALEIILKQDEAGNYYIEWVENSIEKMRRQSAYQSANGSKGGRPKKSQIKPDENPIESQNKSQLGIKKKPLEDVNVYVNEDVVNYFEEGTGETFVGEGFYVDTLEKEKMLTEIQIGATVQLLAYNGFKSVSDNQVTDFWESFKILHFSRHQWYNSFEDLLMHFRNSFKSDLIKNSNKNQYGNKSNSNQQYEQLNSVYAEIKSAVGCG